MQKYKTLTRTTIAELDDLPHVGVYIIAYLGRVMYIGKAEESVFGRLLSHVYKPSPLGAWLRNVQDWSNIRLDVLEAPDVDSIHSWPVDAEAALIRRFRPLLNVALMP